MISGPKLSDIGNQQYKPPPKNTAIRVPSAPKLTYDTPQVITYSPNAGWSNPVGTYYPTTQAYPTTLWNGPSNAAATTPVGGYNYGAQATGNTAAATTAAETKKADPIDYSKYTNDELAKVDSTYSDQRSMYAQLLKKYLEDYTKQNGYIDKDAGLSQEGIEKNRINGMTSMNEDLAARGLGYGGIMAKANNDATQAYKKQSDNVTLNATRAHSDLDFKKNKFEGENGEHGSNMSAARREAYARLAAKQTLV